VTAADKATESWLRDELARLRPDDAVLGEESGAEAGTSAVRWVVDPIDGTVNFVLGLPQYAVSVAAEVDGRTVAGAVLNPATGELFHAHLGGGAYLGDTRLHGPRDVELARAVVGTGFAYAAQRRQRQAAVVAQLLPAVADLRRLGSASLDLCAVAAGRLDAYFEAGLNPWDYAAGLLIATEAGCAATGLRDREPGPTLAAVARPELLADLAALLERLDADRV
ncbi:MAG TPA: inositol monophosphatase family protein, partial [Jatrophihabitantaceae bacterium]|nr:inositol monophosphatase family protein [Jatrophihabitantaceae bacterium]